MVVLADELLEEFFEQDLRESFRLAQVEIEDVSHVGQGGLLAGLVSAVTTQDNKRLFHRLTDELGKTIGKHNVVHKPSIGRVNRAMNFDEAKARESILPRLVVPTGPSEGGRRSPSPSPVRGGSEKEKGSLLGAPSSVQSPSSPLTAGPDPVINPLKFAVLERTPFAIDAAGDDSDEDDEEELRALGVTGGDDDAEVMDEVRSVQAQVITDEVTDLLTGRCVPGGERLGVDRGRQSDCKGLTDSFSHEVDVILGYLRNVLRPSPVSVHFRLRFNSSKSTRARSAWISELPQGHLTVSA